MSSPPYEDWSRGRLGRDLRESTVALGLWHNVLNVKGGPLKAFMHQAVLASRVGLHADGFNESFWDGHLRPLAEDLESFSSYERQLFAEINEGLKFFAFRGFEQTFVIAVHQFLKAVRLRGKVKVSHSLNPVDRCGDRGIHGQIAGRPSGGRQWVLSGLAWLSPQATRSRWFGDAEHYRVLTLWICRRRMSR